MLGRRTLAGGIFLAAWLVGGTPAHADATVLDLRLNQIERVTPGSIVVDQSGGSRDGVVKGRSGGALTRTKGAGASAAVAFPAPCSSLTCPKVLISVPDDDVLDPGLRPFTFGLALRVDPWQTSPGSNVLQKGRWGDRGGQWKLQLDGYHGRPSCVISGYSGDSHLRVTVLARVSVADGNWHDVACRRTLDSVSVIVDGEVVGRRSMTAVRLSSDAPVLVGAKHHTWADNDQYFGAAANVFVRQH